MSDWQVGDLALCVDDGPPGVPTTCTPGAYRLLHKGRVYSVEGVLAPDNHGRAGLLFKELAPPPGGSAWHATRFRKIRPDKHEACEPEFVTLIKRAKRPVSA